MGDIGMGTVMATMGIAVVMGMAAMETMVIADIVAADTR